MDYRYIFRSRKSQLWRINIIDTVESTGHKAIKYGVLYNWYAAAYSTGGASIAPDGWHVPSMAELYTLKNYVGGNSYAYTLKSISSEFWDSPNTYATDEYGFEWVGSGVRSSYTGLFSLLKQEGGIWSTDSTDGESVNVIFTTYNSGSFGYGPGLEKDGYAIRCIKDDSTNENTVTDIDGNIYPTVKIGDQVWMAANLAVEHFNDGTPIAIGFYDYDWAAATGPLCCYYNNDATNVDTAIIPDDPTIVHPDADGCFLDWEGPSDDTYRPIISSTCEMNLYRDAGSIALLNSIIEGPECRFIVQVEQCSNEYREIYNIKWRGFMLQDSMSKPDSYDNVDTIKFKAVDGFGLLKDVEYTGYDVESLLRESIGYWISKLAEYLPLNYLGTSIPMFGLASVWYEDSMAYGPTDDPMINTLISESAWIEIDKYGVSNSISLYDILNHMLIVHNLQLVQWNGIYLLIQQNTYEQDTTRVWYYDNSASFLYTELLDLVDADIPTRLKGGSFSYILPLKQIDSEYEYRQSIFKNNLLPNVQQEGIEYSMGVIDIDTPIQLTGRINTIVNIPASAEDFIEIIYLVTIKNGSYYLKQNYGSIVPIYYTWSLTASSFYISGYFNAYDNPTDYDWTFPILVDLFIPNTVVQDVMTVQFDLVAINGTHASTGTGDNSFLVAKIYVSSANVKMDGTQLFKATVSNSARANTSLEKSILGDGVYKYSAGSLFINDSTDTIVKSELWTIYSDIGETGIHINSLRCKEMLALRRNTVELYTGSFDGIPNIHKGFIYDSKHWAWTSISFNLNMEQYSGTAMAIVLDRTNITIEEPLVNETDNAGDTGAVQFDNINTKIKFTAEGGMAIRLLNKTGATSVRGTIVNVSTATQNACMIAPANSDMPIGVIYENSIPDSSSVWVVVSGIVEVLMKNGVAPSSGYVAYVSDTAGRADCSATLPSTAQHFRELGHLLETKSSGTNVKSRINLHFN